MIRGMSVDPVAVYAAVVATAALGWQMYQWTSLGPPFSWWRRMLGNFQHPPGSGRLRSFIASEAEQGPGRSSA